MVFQLPARLEPGELPEIDLFHDYYKKSEIETKLEKRLGTQHLSLLGQGGLSRVSLVRFPEVFGDLEVAMRYPRDEI
jgi:hypothetical protein